jgi:hypothetical protein
VLRSALAVEIFELTEQQEEQKEHTCTPACTEHRKKLHTLHRHRADDIHRIAAERTE